VRASENVERIRLAAERHARVYLERDFPDARSSYRAPDARSRGSRPFRSGLLLTESMAPEAYACAREAMAVLGVDDSVELYQTAAEWDQACLVLGGKPIVIELSGGYLGRLDRRALLSLLGHEIGHALAHCQSDFEWAYALSRRAISGPKRAYACAAEFTADRFGILACQDLDAVLRLQMISIAGSSASALRLDAEAYLVQCRKVANDALAFGGAMEGDTHPEHHIRSYASWLFSESDLYAAITGKGSARRSLAEIDDLLTRLLAIEPRRAETRAAAKPDRRVEAAPIDLLTKFEDFKRRFQK
jgi:hypothetical protein